MTRIHLAFILLAIAVCYVVAGAGDMPRTDAEMDLAAKKLYRAAHSRAIKSLERSNKWER